MLPEVIEATIVCPFNDAEAVERALDEHDGDVAAIILEPIPHNIGAVLPQPGFLERLRELATKHGTVLVFDEVITGFRHGLGGYQAVAGRNARPDHARQGDGERLARLGARRQGRADGSLLDHARAARLLRRHVQRASRRRARRRSRRSTSSSASPCTSTSSGSASAPARGCRRSTTASACRPSWPGSAPSSSATSSKGPVVSYDDLLRNDVDLFVGYRRELMKDGIFELPLNLKRSHFSYAHTDEDVDRLLAATEGAVTRYLETRA